MVNPTLAGPPTTTRGRFGIRPAAARPPAVAEGMEPRRLLAAAAGPVPPLDGPLAGRDVRYAEPDGTAVRVRVRGGPGTVTLTPGDAGRVDLAVDGSDRRTRVDVTARGGSDGGRATLADVSAAGSLAALAGRRLDVTGDVTVGGTLGRLAVGQLGVPPTADGTPGADRTVTIGGAGVPVRVDAGVVYDFSLTSAAP